MNEQWQELKETIIEMRDNNGALTQQEVCKFLANLMDVLEKQMSSSGNPNKWIPVSERLPEEDGFYLATCDGEICGEDEPISCMAEFENGKWVDDEDDYQCVLAWMPLPKPYKESEREMTNKKAIEILEECWRYSKTYKYTDAEIREAFDLAIKALEREVNQEEDNSYREKKWGRRK